MRDPGAVRLVECAGNLDSNRQGFGERKRTAFESTDLFGPLHHWVAYHVHELSREAFMDRVREPKGGMAEPEAGDASGEFEAFFRAEHARLLRALSLTRREVAS